MEILFVSITFAPDQNPNALRWGSLLDHLSEKGHSITVVTAKSPNCPRVENRGKIEIFRIGYKTLFDWFSNWLPGKKMSRNVVSNTSSKRPSLFHFLSETMADLTWRKIFWSDGSCIWYFPALRMIKTLLKKKDFDTLVTVSMPFTAAWLGRYIKNRRPEIRWVNDVEDPFSLQLHTPKNNLWFYRKKNFLAEEEVLKRADQTVVTNSAMQQMYNQVFKPFGKTLIIPPSLSRYKSEKSIRAIKEKRIIFTYLGSFYSKIREPKILLSLFQHYFLQYPEMQKKSLIRIVGGIPKNLMPQFREYTDLSGNLELVGEISHDQVVNFMNTSHILINIGNTTGYQLPSKVVEYLSSGIPVINICQIPDDSFRLFANQVESVFNYCTYFQEQKSELERLNEFIAWPLRPMVIFNPNKYTDESIVRQFLQGITKN